MTGEKVDDVTETSLAEVFEVLRALSAVGCRFWLEGGWGVDALLGRQTRPHRDLDVDLDARCAEAALTVLAAMGYTIETDWRPNRVELKAPARGRVDLHPLLIDDDGTARQAALEGGFHVFPRSFFVTGSLAGVPVPCVSVTAQRRFRTGYELRDIDLHDLAVLDDLDPGAAEDAGSPSAGEQQPSRRRPNIHFR
jgi:lincosamide nucleotidyltransferase A/C/D/E